MGGRRGVSLIELLVTVAVVMVLVGITIPVLRTVAMQRHDVKNLTSLRSTHQQFREYANDNGDYFVNAGPPRRPGLLAVIDYGPGNGFDQISYLWQETWWPGVLATYTRSGSPTWHSTHWPSPLIGPANVQRGYELTQYIAESGFHYSAACITEPEMWSGMHGPGEDLSRYYQRIRWSLTAHPSAKGMLFDSTRPQASETEERRPTVFVDGSAEMMNFLEPAPFQGPRGWPPVEWTPEGILGRDFTR